MPFLFPVALNFSHPSRFGRLGRQVKSADFIRT
jgi:hypothetical protein